MPTWLNFLKIITCTYKLKGSKEREIKIASLILFFFSLIMKLNVHLKYKKKLTLFIQCYTYQLIKKMFTWHVFFFVPNKRHWNSELGTCKNLSVPNSVHVPWDMNIFFLNFRILLFQNISNDFYLNLYTLQYKKSLN